MNATTVQSVLLGVLIGVVLTLGAPAIATHDPDHIEGARLTLTEPDGSTVNWLVEQGNARADLKSRSAHPAFIFGERIQVRESLSLINSDGEVRIFRKGDRLMAKIPGHRAVAVARF